MAFILLSKIIMWAILNLLMDWFWTAGRMFGIPDVDGGCFFRLDVRGRPCTPNCDDTTCHFFS